MTADSLRLYGPTMTVRMNTDGSFTMNNIAPKNMEQRKEFEGYLGTPALNLEQTKWCIRKLKEISCLFEERYTQEAIQKMEKMLVQFEYITLHPGEKPRSDAIDLHYRERHDLSKDFLETSGASLREFQTDREQEILD